MTNFDLTAPTVPGVSAVENQSFSEAVLEILGDALAHFQPDLREAAGACLAVLAAVAALSMLSMLPGKKIGDRKSVV